VLLAIAAWRVERRGFRLEYGGRFQYKFVVSSEFEYYRCASACAGRRDFHQCFAMCLARAHEEQRRGTSEFDEVR